VPENDAAVLASLVSKLGRPSVTPFLYTPGFEPKLSAAFVPDASSRRQ
jgi:hypothetical protein